ncbi:IS630 transposase-related protein [Neisseria weixii]|uniref:Transposase n=1 Tax=Neisseria weixii TaxID=1853276 RepID=A0A3N4MYK0_9NEIS|nr:IS630 transposase-related protein [Neisseria weixii]ATD64188.1 transposase [Neisseria weixii]RPD84720.1 transposase [Neisseria weixii]RPD84951.1 transposase [Neisseria weixii]
MTYSTDFRQPALSKIKQDRSIYKVAKEMGIGRATLSAWIQDPEPNPYPKDRKCRKINREAPMQDVEQYPDDFQYERAQRFGCSAKSIGAALKKWNISRKKDL